MEWCVLTDGNVWRVYKSNAPGDVDEKLLFEVKLADLLTDEASETLNRLQTLSRNSVRSGKLEALSDTHFTDRHVEADLTRLLTEPSPKLVNLLYSELRKQVTRAAIKASLQRQAGQKPMVEVNIQRKAKVEKGKYDYNHHFAGKPRGVKKLYDRLHEAIMQLAGGGAIKRTFRALYIAYSVKNNFVEVQVQKNQLKLFVELPYAAAPDKRDIVRDVSKVGHWGTGDTEVRLKSADDLDYAMSIIRLAYERTPK